MRKFLSEASVSNDGPYGNMKNLLASLLAFIGVFVCMVTCDNNGGTNLCGSPPDVECVKNKLSELAACARVEQSKNVTSDDARLSIPVPAAGLRAFTLGTTLSNLDNVQITDFRLLEDKNLLLRASFKNIICEADHLLVAVGVPGQFPVAVDSSVTSVYNFDSQVIWEYHEGLPYSQDRANYFYSIENCDPSVLSFGKEITESENEYVIKARNAFGSNGNDPMMAILKRKQKYMMDQYIQSSLCNFGIANAVDADITVITGILRAQDEPQKNVLELCQHGKLHEKLECNRDWFAENGCCKRSCGKSEPHMVRKRVSLPDPSQNAFLLRGVDNGQIVLQDIKLLVNKKANVVLLSMDLEVRANSTGSTLQVTRMGDEPATCVSTTGAIYPMKLDANIPMDGKGSCVINQDSMNGMMTFVDILDSAWITLGDEMTKSSDPLIAGVAKNIIENPKKTATEFYLFDEGWAVAVNAFEMNLCDQGMTDVRNSH